MLNVPPGVHVQESDLKIQPCPVPKHLFGSEARLPSISEKVGPIKDMIKTRLSRTTEWESDIRISTFDAQVLLEILEGL